MHYVNKLYFTWTFGTPVATLFATKTTKSAARRRLNEMLNRSRRMSKEDWRWTCFECADNGSRPKRGPNAVLAARLCGGCADAIAYSMCGAHGICVAPLETCNVVLLVFCVSYAQVKYQRCHYYVRFMSVSFSSFRLCLSSIQLCSAFCFSLLSRAIWFSALLLRLRLLKCIRLLFHAVPDLMGRWEIAVAIKSNGGKTKRLRCYRCLIRNFSTRYETHSINVCLFIWNGTATMSSDSTWKRVNSVVREVWVMILLFIGCGESQYRFSFNLCEFWPANEVYWKVFPL